MSDFRLGDLIQAIDENKEAMNVQLTGSYVDSVHTYGYLGGNSGSVRGNTYDFRMITGTNSTNPSGNDVLNMSDYVDDEHIKDSVSDTKRFFSGEHEDFKHETKYIAIPVSIAGWRTFFFTISHTFNDVNYELDAYAIPFFEPLSPALSNSYSQLIGTLEMCQPLVTGKEMPAGTAVKVGMGGEGFKNFSQAPIGALLVKLTPTSTPDEDGGHFRFAMERQK